MANLSDEYMSADKLSEFDFFRFDDDVVFAIHEEGFNNIFYVYHTNFDTYSAPGYTMLTQP